MKLMTHKEFKIKSAEFLIYLELEKNCASNTLRSYKNDLHQFYLFWEHVCTNNIPIGLNQALERFFSMFTYKKIKNSSLARKLSCFKSFEKYLKKEGISLHINLTRPYIEKKSPATLSMEEVFFLLDTLPDSQMPTQRPLRDKAILELLYATGIHCSELVNIRFADINLEEKIIKISARKKRQGRIVLFGNKAKERLIAYFTHERGPAATLQDPIFVNCRNELLTSRSIQRIILMFSQFLKSGKKITPRKIRHSFATHLLNQGVDLGTVKELLGHKTITSTQKYKKILEQ